MKLKLLSVVVILLVSLGVYGNSLLNGFVYDDTMQVLENPWITDAGYLHDIFSKNSWSFRSQRVVSNYYRPLMHVLFMFDYHLFGLKAWGFHLVNLLFHGANAVLVFLIAARLLSAPLSSPSPPHRVQVFSGPLIAALLFAVHPVHTEAVTWISGLPDLSCSFFFLLSFYLYIRSGGRMKGEYLLSVVSFFFAALSKEPALTLPFILALYDYAFRKAGDRYFDAFKRYIPFIIVAAIYFGIRFHALGGFAPDKRHADMSIYQWGINIFPLFMQYLGKLIFPVNLNAFYVFHPLPSVFEMKGAFSLIGTAAFAIASRIAFRKSRAVFFSLLFTVITLLPSLYIPGLSFNVFADRYLYLPSAGFVMLPALLVARARARFPERAGTLAAATVIVLGLFSAGTVDRNAVWRDDCTLWADTVKKSPDAALVHVNYGQAIQMTGRRDEAIEHYQIALKLDPNDAITHFDLGLAYFLNGSMDMAVEQFRIVLAQDPDYPNAAYYLQLAASSKSHR